MSTAHANQREGFRTPINILLQEHFLEKLYINDALYFMFVYLYNEGTAEIVHINNK